MRASQDAFLIIEDIYRTVGDDSRWPAVLRSLQGQMRSATCAVIRHDFRACAGAIRFAAGMAEPYVAAYNARYAALNPWLRREECYRREGMIWRGRDVMPYAELVRSEFYRDWLRPQNLYHRGCTVLRWREPTALYVEALRPARTGAFDRRELDLCRLFAPHLGRALELSERLAAADAGRARGLDEAVARIPGAFMVVGQDERLLAASPDAERLLAGGESFRAGGRQRLRLVPGSDNDRFHRQVGAALRTASGGHRDGDGGMPHPSVGGELTVPGGGGATAKILPLPVGALPGQDRPAAAVVVEPACPSEDELRERYGLTRAEARLACLLARGLSVQDAAARLGIGLTTARTHLQRTYDKTGTHRQGQLVALLLGTAERDDDPA